MHVYDNVDDYNVARIFDYKEPWTSVTNGVGANYNKGDLDYEKESKTPLTFYILSDGNIGWKAYNSSSTRTIQYSKNGGEWSDITSTTEGVTIPVVTGDVLKFKGDTWPGSGLNNYSQFTSTCDFTAYGNPVSLKYGEELTGNETLGSYCFIHLFENCTGLISTPVLPAQKAPAWCYAYMFQDCTSLMYLTNLPATTLYSYSYRDMFRNCTSITTAPELPATSLDQCCYNDMFLGCTSLTTVPAILPATRLYYYCYGNMFYGCTSLTTAPVLPATTLASRCYQSMFQGCTSLTTATELPATTLTTYCYKYMFYKCTNLTAAPELPATTLTEECYYEMFYGCTSLNYIKCLATNISATGALTRWLSSSSTGTFYKAAGVTWPSGTSGIPSRWTVVEV